MVGLARTILAGLILLLVACAHTDDSDGLDALTWWQTLQPNAQISLPTDRVGPYPAVVLFHGCSGRHGRDQDYASLANDLGFAAVIVDSLSPRVIGKLGAAGVCGGVQLRGDQRAADLAATLDYLASRSDIDASSIRLVGWSHGGWSILELVDEDLDNWAARMTPAGQQALSELDALMLVYPYCADDHVLNANALSATRLHLVVVRDDQSVDEEVCLDVINRLKRQGGEASVTILDGTRHAFDTVPVDAMNDNEQLFSRVAQALFIDFLQGPAP